ncbi:putative reverse transcriptase domain-containing protein [Tanacetum coccineum]|uniref:Reverse transcriptase domain-containing protein n=1 Tax=Tanacetum coccineum TaxID=301880 RepID=A0ABQ5AG77_9ASTR
MSLTGAASRWLRNKPSGSITTWKDLKTKFLSKYCPPARTTKKMEEINNFQQEPNENLYQAWERFKELLMKTRSTETSDGLAAIQAQLNNLGREIKKVNEKVYAAQVGCKQCKGPHYIKDCPLKKEGKILKEAYYTQFGAPFHGGGYIATAPGFYQRNNANPSDPSSTDAAIRNQEASIKTLEIQIRQMSKSISTIAEADASSIRRIGSHQYAISTGQNTTLMYETKKTTIPFPSCLNDCYYENNMGSYGPQFLEAYSYGASHIDKSIPRKEKDPGSFTLPCYINNVCFDNALADLGASVSVMPLSTYLNLGLGELAHTKLTFELAYRTVKYPKGIAENVLVGIGKFVFPIDFIILDMPEDIKVPLILGRPFLSTAHAKIDVFKRKITLRVGEEKIIFKSVKPASSLIKRVYMLSLRERMELDLEARLMGETLVLNRSLDPFFGDYIELNDLNVPLELRRDQVDDLMPTIEEGKVVEEFRARNDARMVSKFFGYPSDCDHDKKIRIDCAHNLKFSCMIGFEFLHANFFPFLYVNVMSKKFYNSIRKDKLEYKRNNVVGALMNIPIFVGTFSILTDFAVLEDMDAYHNEGMGDVIFGKPFLREVGINARRFEGMITIYNGNEEVTYQMVRSHPRFKHHTNEQCNKIPPLLKMSEEDMMNGISHSYQKLKSFYKEVLNLGLEYVRDAKMEEWLTRGHKSVHKME